MDNKKKKITTKMVLLKIFLSCRKQSNVQTGQTVHQIPCRAAMNSVEWNPKYNLLAYAGDDKNKYQADEGEILLSPHCVCWNNFFWQLRHVIKHIFLVAGVFRIFGFESSA